MAGHADVLKRSASGLRVQQLYLPSELDAPLIAWAAKRIAVQAGMGKGWRSGWRPCAERHS